ncbi:MAG TPA: NAD(P)-dependent oxidoreductase [Dinghuibacter sp.]|uniref:NAD(P)-dependent oxidoreductase n=1 Tax=Dinghuibacter sp. TaxID=2024697 RepID=UPI002C2F6BA9|nr:NAD(P)-dependent oxidoreductase [Dinghuibacter sp.]HTJ14672.1 NAD(P)-dependent oxidoreductase [Dinghuibacter sp.]
MEMVKLGWVGLGKMGVPMVSRLLGAGYGVTVYNRNRAKAATVAVAAAVAETPAKVAEAADIVFVMVSDDAATRAVFTGENGLLKGGGNKIYVNMSSVSAEVSREMAAMAKVEGGAYVDAPVSGSVKQAEEGTLVVMVGAEADLFERVKPVLSAMGKLVLNVGGTGVGNTAKLAINVLLAIHAQGLAESVVFARKHGVRAEDFLTIVNNSAMSNVFAKIKGDAILKENYQAAFALKHIAKDLGLAKGEGLDTPLADTAYRTYTDAEPALGEEDIIAVIKAVGGR